MLRLIVAASLAIVVGAPSRASAQAGERFDVLGVWSGDGFDGPPQTESTADTLLLKAGTVWTPGVHADFVLRFEYRPLSPGGAAALLLRSSIDNARERQSYAVVLDGSPERGRLSGERQVLRPLRFESRPPVTDPAAWIAVDVRADFDRLIVSLDGVRVSEADGAEEGFGTIGFRAGTGGVELRGMRLAPIAVAADIPTGLPRIDAPGMTMPAIVHRTFPRYTRAAMLAKAQGMARLELVVESDGRVGAIRLIDAPHPDLAVAAVACVRRWRFSPALRDGTPVAVVVRAEVVFHLK